MASRATIYRMSFLTALIMASRMTGDAARHLLDTAEAPEAVPTIPTFTVPSLPTFPPMPVVPTVPKLAVPPMPVVPTVPKVTLPPLPAIPSIPKVTIPQMPSIPVMPSIPNMPTLPFFTPPPAAAPLQEQNDCERKKVGRQGRVRGVREMQMDVGGYVYLKAWEDRQAADGFRRSVVARFNSVAVW
ncbi:hypothetical protein B296_00005686 [Ensete ventricosum]|uniref:Uncharacterized protein n=1 Tax=Ensete ventricosum TaxID=4639 RepID=A0A427B657_ENSVE|nr:hypothetical protein B296_00005686 [Ensete ventricosum]